MMVNYDDDYDDENDNDIYLDHLYRLVMRHRYSRFLVGGMVEPGVEHVPAYVFDSDNEWKLDQAIDWQNVLKATPERQSMYRCVWHTRTNARNSENGRTF